MTQIRVDTSASSRSVGLNLFGRDRLVPRPIDEWLVDRTSRPMAPGSVLFHVPSAAFQSPGGGEVQFLQTARHLERLGQPVRPLCPWTDRLRDASLLHLFGMSREGLELARLAKSIGLPVVLSPICWYEPRAVAALAPSALRAGFELAKLGVQRILPRRPGWRRSLLRLADRILPNSEAEARQLGRHFAIEPRRFRVVPNGVEPRFARADPSDFRERVGEDFVLYVGRIEPRKNLLGLIRALRPTGLPLVAIGDPLPGHDAYAAARVFALPSWFETPGLAALEAALAGAAVVVTPHGCTREYFGNLALYARPDRPREIARAVRGAWEVGPLPALRERIGARYLWSEVARRTAEVYHEVAR